MFIQLDTSNTLNSHVISPTAHDEHPGTAPISWYVCTRCTIKDCNFSIPSTSLCSTQGNYQAECQQLPGIRSKSQRMNWVLSWLFYSKCSRWIGEPDVGAASVENQALTYIYFSGNYSASNIWLLWAQYETILLGMDYWWCNGQFLLWIKRFYNTSHSSLFTWRLDYSRSDQAHLGISCIHYAWHSWHGYYRNIQVGSHQYYYMYSCEFP